MIRRAIILAAELGAQQRPMTETLPQALLPVGGKPIIDHLLDRLAAHGVERAVVSLHHQRAALEAKLRGHQGLPRLEMLAEPEPIGDGLAAAHALAILPPEPVFLLGTGALWLDGFLPTLDRLAAAWDDSSMDALLLLQGTVTARGYDGPGEYFLDPAGRARRRIGGEIASHVFAGVALAHPRCWGATPTDSYPLARIFERCEGASRLFGLVHDGLWFRIATPAAASATEVALGYRPMPAAVAESLTR